MVRSPPQLHAYGAPTSSAYIIASPDWHQEAELSQGSVREGEPESEPEDPGMREYRTQRTQAALHIQLWFRRAMTLKREQVEREAMQKGIATKTLKAFADRIVERQMTVELIERDASARKGTMYWTQSNQFSVAVSCVVLCNALVMGWQLDNYDEFPAFFDICEHFFCAIFLFEVLAHFSVEGPRIYFKDHINWLDFLLVMTSVVDIWVLSALGAGGTLKLMALLRLLRLIRLARLLRLFRMFKELTLLVQGFANSVKALTWSIVFLFIAVYIFSIYARNTMGVAAGCDNISDCSDDDDQYYEFNPESGNAATFFGSVPVTMLTLAVCLTEGCGNDLVRPIVFKDTYQSMFWILYLFTTSLCILNLVVGIFCENANTSSATQKKEEQQAAEAKRNMMLAEIVQVFVEMDTNIDGIISREECLEGVLNNKVVKELLEDLGVQGRSLWDTLDPEKSGKLTFNQFFEGLIAIMQGSEDACVKDIVGTHLLCESTRRKFAFIDSDTDVLIRRTHEQKNNVQKISQLLNSVAQQSAGLDDRLSELVGNAYKLRSLANARSKAGGGSGFETPRLPDNWRAHPPGQMLGGATARPDGDASDTRSDVSVSGVSLGHLEPSLKLSSIERAVSDDADFLGVPAVDAALRRRSPPLPKVACNDDGSNWRERSAFWRDHAAYTS